MRNAYLLAALVGFAIINTAFLGAYLASTQSVGGPNFGPAGTTVTEIASSTAVSTSTGSATSSQSALSTSSGTVPQGSTNYTASGGSLSSITYGPTQSAPGPSAWSSMIFQFFELHSTALAPGSWVLVGGMWIWRGRMKSKWTGLGFDSDVFTLFVRMKGAKTRIRLLDALLVPKDRLQLAHELGLDWKAVDRHIEVLSKYGFVYDRVVYGKVRMYELTSTGKLLLQLLDELNRQSTIDPGAGLLTTAPREGRVDF